MSEETAEKETRRIDKIRASYYQFYTDTKWGDRNNYDLVINSARLGIPATAEVLAQYVLARAGRCEAAAV